MNPLNEVYDGEQVRGPGELVTQCAVRLAAELDGLKNAGSCLRVLDGLARLDSELVAPVLRIAIVLCRGTRAQDGRGRSAELEAARALAARFGAKLYCACGRDWIGDDGRCPRCADDPQWLQDAYRVRSPEPPP